MPSKTERQHRAMEAAAHGHSTLGIPESVGEEFVAADAEAITAAGVMLVAPDGMVLFLKRASTSDQPGTWCFPAGRIEQGEDPETAARRECKEETGHLVDELVELEQDSFFMTFLGTVSDKFIPVDQTNEHVAFAWAPPDQPPEPLHPGVKKTLSSEDQDDRFTYNYGDLEMFSPDGKVMEMPEEEIDPSEVPEGPEYHLYLD